MNQGPFSNKKIAIIGGTGTLGRSLIQAICSSETKSKILIFSRDEIKQLEMMEDPKFDQSRLEFTLGDVRDFNRLNEALTNVDVVFHLAALKHVTMAERNPEECWDINVMGTKNVYQACLNNKVERAILVSTDKAENPLGVYGRSKLESERFFLREDSNLKSFVIRLGNIIYSRGSVWESFKRQRKMGVLRVTHMDATRFFITQKKAADFLLRISSGESDCQIFYPKMESFKVIDLAEIIAPESSIEVIGLRKGEKLHEEINGISSSICTVEKNRLKDLLMN